MSKRITYTEPNQLEAQAAKKINNVNMVLDVGCGIRPQTFINPFVHICYDAHQQYLDVLQTKLTRRKTLTGKLQYIFVNKTVDELISNFPRKSVDTIFLLDVIEHLDKNQGLELMKAFNEIARHQIVIFTPLGFVPQEHPDGKDAWGLDGGKWQQHKSGWTPDDFDNSWEFLVCKNFHSSDNLGNKHENEVGAFFAIKTVGNPPDTIAKKNLLDRALFWINTFLLSQKIK
ncbi:class I SAM-dependent methyltransferase [Lacibacter sp.]|uniref:class I SAM-dependent methyltransferase n=1 Tax=Lacibacter sp. TaxID=1915409 RepID=UPI002B4B04BC|nr:class I SAM-dependent methyltransferase [Lacibacter sp.]HLP36105.1 class I SAM-dependent methyltransferase [Lacibacter sp.]